MKSNAYQHKLLFFCIVLLVIGSLYYLLFRHPIIVSSYFNLDFLHIQLFSSSLNSLPSFIHQLSFVLLTWLALDRSHEYFALFFWLIINSIFELGQQVSNLNHTILPKIIEEYLNNGTYSYGDMIAIFFATFVAYIIIKQQKRDL